MRRAVRDGGELCQAVGLSPEIADAAAAGQFPVFAPWPYIGRIRRGDPHDPLLRQVLPLEDENLAAEGFSTDPVGDGPATRSPGLIHKYRGRALLVTTGACAIHCRYCFRREFPYGDTPHSLSHWQAALDEIAADTSIHEVIYSGGDPLTLVDDFLAELTGRLAEIAHVRRLRIHTRLPIVIPQRINDELLNWLCGTRLQPIVVIHANHPAEIDGEVAESLGRLVDRGIVVLNQAVLLRGVNNNIEALAGLSERLVELRVMPYYLHQLDRVRGAAHFEVPIEAGRKLIQQLRERLPGYAVPRYVQEVAGEPAKVVLA
jgi:EF-P beta-lysylation protein EpmB